MDGEDFMPIFFEKKQLVTPGDLLAEGEYLPGENTYVEQNKIYASRIGLVDTDNKKVNVVALRAFYVPKMGDIVIGTVIEVGFNGWTIGIQEVAFSYDGWIVATGITNDVKNPKKTMPLAFVIGPVIVLFAYIFYFFGLNKMLGSEYIISVAAAGGNYVDAAGKIIFGS
ncbi:MAG: hypothetical protein ACLQO7_12150, partial [Candidatus Bathyarchaeia archaeon]